MSRLLNLSILLLCNIYISYSFTFYKFSEEELIEKLDRDNIVLIDTRELADIRSTYFIKGSQITPVSMSSPWFGKIYQNKNIDIVILAHRGKEEKAIKAYLSIGYYNILGYANIEDISNKYIYKSHIMYNNNTLADLTKLVKNKEYIIDIREIEEYKETGIIKESKTIPLSTLNKNYNELPRDKPIYIMCKSGGRATLIMSFLYKLGFRNDLIVMDGGMNKVKEEGYPLVPYKVI